jgi:diguanylate cyclase (GGDEF)-like protein
MKLEYGFLRKKVASRVVLLFFLSALVPIAATALFSITYVTDLLVDQSYRRLQHASKLYGMALLDRLQIIDDELRKATAELSKVKNIKETIDADSPDPVTAILNGIRQKKQIDKLTIEFISVSNLISEGYDESQSDKSILFNAVNSAGARKVYLRRIIAAGQSDKMITLLAELNNRYLWGEQETLPFSTYLCVLGGGHTILFCPQQDHDALLAGLDASPQKYEPIKMKWSNRNGDNLAVSWDFFIQSGFSGPSWKILSSMPETDALLPVYAFHRIYPIVILFSLLVVLLLSLIQVRKTMVPLQRLVSATRRLANYEFGEAVKVNSNDEFAALADSFNVMAVRLEKQFNELKIFSEIDRLILTYSDLNVVLARIFDTAHLIVSSDIIGITLLDKNETTNGDAYVKELATGKLTHTENALIPETEAAKLLVEEAALSVDMKTQSWHILEPLHNCDVAVAQVYRILLDGKLRGIFCLGYRAETADVAEDSGYVRGIIDRLAVALATADRDEKLYYQANFDHLTGLPNRQLFNDRLERHIIQARRKKERAALLYIDLDRFKNINDSLGHASGDKLLWEVANRMKRCIRETDTLSRLGGDEFVIVLSSVSSPKDAGNIAENIIHSISKPLHISAREIFINASIGIVVYPEDGKNNKELISHADAAMYRAKESGRGRYMFFEESMNKENVRSSVCITSRR